MGFWERWDAEAAQLEKTEPGRAFVAAGFRMAHQGGGCGCWQRTLVGGQIMLISDLEGCSGELGDDPADHYLVGLYTADMDAIVDPVESTRDATDAIAAAARLAGSWW